MSWLRGLVFGGLCLFAAALHAEPVVVASKNFNESYLLAEIVAQLLEGRGIEVERKFGLGGTLICYEALLNDEADVYIEYTGTLSQAILKLTEADDNSEAHMNTLLAPSGLETLPSLGFNNTYAVALKAALAKRENLRSIADLAGRDDLAMAFSHEFLDRADGWPGLAQRYGLDGQPVGIEHGLAYQAIDQGKIDITDAYSTDGDLERYGLTVLADDRGYFPRYFAVPLLRSALPAEVKRLIGTLAGRLDDDRMRRLNARVAVDKATFAVVAAEFLAEEGLAASARVETDYVTPLVRNTLIHLKLTGIALLAGCLVGIPLGVLVFRSAAMSRTVMYVAGLMQTVPSIALLALMIPLFGIGELPAVIALFLYSLLPILRSTVTALTTIDPLLKRVAEAIGLTRFEQLRFVLVPLAMPNVLAGVKTAAVISIGTATLAAFIGAGGLGEPIVTGLSLNDTNLILQGAIPAAVLAILVELLFEGVERLLVRPHMRRGQMPV